jgi:hypothetical protein
MPRILEWLFLQEQSTPRVWAIVVLTGGHPSHHRRNPSQPGLQETTMKKMIMTLAAFSLFASGSAYAGCGSHGGGYSRGYSAPSSSRHSSTQAPRAAAKAVKAVKAAAKAAKEAEASVAASDAADVKLPKQAVAAVEAIAGTGTLGPIAAEASRECKQYSATIGSLINVACE